MNKGSLGEQELQLLQYVSDHHPTSVREAVEGFGAINGLARTTVLTMLERLRRKGFLTRRTEGSVNVYSPSVEKGEMLRGVVQDFVERTLGGSLSPFVAYLAKARNLSDDEIEKLRELVSESEVKKDGE